MEGAGVNPARSGERRYLIWVLIIYRIPLFQNQQNDKFLPHYKLESKLPDIPVRAKVFHYKIDYRKPAQYELSSVELT